MVYRQYSSEALLGMESVPLQHHAQHAIRLRLVAYEDTVRPRARCAGTSLQNYVCRRYRRWHRVMARVAFLTFLTDFSVGTAVNAAEGISPTFMFTSLLFLLTVIAEYFSATFSVSLTYFVACFTSALLSTTESDISHAGDEETCRLKRDAEFRWDRVQRASLSFVA
ncbi:hypothetical protein EYF80_006874 [Liparis tanakae]|uniref:Uncharacterized protein n=1 Tax=Liparis tanakae TaxID=230148 RepID=A0A4Z2IYS7_9TELE|nr:hypothetical protein EYF80_006874 [Liparis tanakae]